MFYHKILERKKKETLSWSNSLFFQVDLEASDICIEYLYRSREVPIGVSLSASFQMLLVCDFLSAAFYFFGQKSGPPQYSLESLGFVSPDK